MKTKQEVIVEFNTLVNEGWLKAYQCLLDNNVFIGELAKHAILMSPDRKPTRMSASGIQLVRLMADVGECFKLRGNRDKWELTDKDCCTKEEIDAEVKRREKIKSEIANAIKSDEYQEYIRLKKKFEKFEPFIKNLKES